MPLLPPDQTHYGENGDANNLYVLTSAVQAQPAYFPAGLSASPTTLTGGVTPVFTDSVSQIAGQYWRVTAQIRFSVISGTAGAGDQLQTLAYFGPVGAAPFTGNSTRGGQTITPVIYSASGGSGGYTSFVSGLSCIVPVSTTGPITISGFPASGNGAVYGMTVQSLVLERVY